MVSSTVFGVVSQDKSDFFVSNKAVKMMTTQTSGHPLDTHDVGLSKRPVFQDRSLLMQSTIWACKAINRI